SPTRCPEFQGDAMKKLPVNKKQLSTMSFAQLQLLQARMLKSIEAMNGFSHDIDRAMVELAPVKYGDVVTSPANPGKFPKTKCKGGGVWVSPDGDKWIVRGRRFRKDGEPRESADVLWSIPVSRARKPR